MGWAPAATLVLPWTVREYEGEPCQAHSLVMGREGKREKAEVPGPFPAASTV
jgi:hypothetical protein